MIPLAVPNLAGREAEYLQECIDTGFVSSVGPFVTRFEAMSAAACGAGHAVAVSSGTAALHLALVTAGVRPGDLVVAPSFTFIATANAIAHCGATPWLMDCDAASWSLDPRQVAVALAEHTEQRGENLVHRPTGRRVAAIVPVYALGNPPDMGPLGALARQYGLPLVADGAAALGVTYRGAAVGSLAAITMVSFNGNKTVTAGGGGILVTDQAALAALARHLSTTARSGSDYHHDRVGYNYRMTNLQAAVGCAQLEQLEAFVDRKRGIRRRYDAAFADLPGIELLPQPDWGQSACWFSGIRLPTDRDTAAFCATLRERGIEARTFWKPIHLQPPYVDAPRETMAVTDAEWARIVTLPCSTGLSEDDQERVIAAVTELAQPRHAALPGL
jgi:dTDP-4-amino-4,6-dideoxygalactose transaminase